MSLNRVYLDHAATTPMVPAAVEAMTRELTRVGNASSLHGSGRGARRVVEESREEIAACLGAEPSEVIFTSGGTESDNLALKGAYWAARRSDPARTGLVSSVIEHHAVLDSLGWLSESEGADVTLVGVDDDGVLDLAQLERSITARTALVSVIWGNNEVGTVQPMPAITARAAEHGALSHADAVQVVGHLPVDFSATGLDLLTLTAHKLGGPYGVGALLAKREIQLTSLLHGGGQERDVRSGTLDVPAVAGFAAAVSQAVYGVTDFEARVRALRAELVAGVLDVIPEATLNGVLEPARSLPGIASVSFPGCEADMLLMLLDAARIDCSAGSACSAGVSEPSHVLMAMGRTEHDARSSVRFSLGHTSTTADVAALLEALPVAVDRARAAGSYAR